MQSSDGDFADSLAVFPAPKRIGLRSHIRLSGVLVKSSSITSSNVSTYLQPLSQLSRQNEIHNQKFHTWRKRSALDIVYYRLWSARQRSVCHGEKTLQRLCWPIDGPNGITKATQNRGAAAG